MDPPPRFSYLVSSPHRRWSCRTSSAQGRGSPPAIRYEKCHRRQLLGSDSLGSDRVLCLSRISWQLNGRFFTGKTARNKCLPFPPPPFSLTHTPVPGYHRGRLALPCSGQSQAIPCTRVARSGSQAQAQARVWCRRGGMVAAGRWPCTHPAAPGGRP